MELKHVKDLMAAMQRFGTQRMVFEQDGTKLELERPSEVPAVHTTEYIHVPAAQPAPVDVSAHTQIPRSAADLPKASPPPSKADEAEQLSTDGSWVTAPIVGTFYVAAAPGEDPFVKVGDKVDAGSVVCIIEAMKVMNEVKAGVSGVIEELVVEDGHPVDYGSKLFRVRAT